MGKKVLMIAVLTVTSLLTVNDEYFVAQKKESEIRQRGRTRRMIRRRRR